MAENYAITMTEKNDVDYDNLFPQTVSSQVLLDASAKATQSLEDGATLNDSIADIVGDGGGFQVGDTLISARINLSDKWVLENGASLQKTNYPELAQNIGTTLGSKVQNTAVASNAVDNKNFAMLSMGKDAELLLSYKSEKVQSSNYPFDSIIDNNTGIASNRTLTAPVYDSMSQKYYVGYIYGTSGTHDTDLYSGDTLDSMSIVTEDAFRGNVMGSFIINNNIYFDVYVTSNSRHSIYKKSSTDDSVSLLMQLSNGNIISKFMYTDDTNGYILTTNNAVKPTSADKFITNSTLGNIEFGSFGSQIVGTLKFPTNDMSQYNGVIGLCGHISGETNVQTWITKDRENWIKIPSGITAYGDDIVTATMTADKFFYSIAVNGTTSIYQIDITGTTYNPVLSYKLQDTLTHGIYDDVNNRIYYTNEAGNIYSFTIDDGILLPEFSPSGGLYAYMKVKP